MATGKGSRVPQDPNLSPELRKFLDEQARKEAFESLTIDDLTVNNLASFLLGLSVTAGGIIITAGGLTITAGGLTVAGTISFPAGSIANASLVSPPIFTKSFTSSQQTITSAGSLTLAHSLGTTPTLIQAALVCQSADGNYATNDVVIVNPHGNDPGGTGSRGVSIVPDATNLNIRYGSSGNAFFLLDKTSGNAFGANNGSWKAKFMAWA